MNEMEEIQVAKVTVNIGCGEAGEKVDKAERLLEKLTGKSPVRTESGDAMKTFGRRAGLEIGVKATLRGEEAEEFLEKVLPASDGLDESNFDGNGNFSFGVGEYIDVTGMDYDSEIGMMGFEVAVSLERPGYRVRRRDYRPSDIGKDHRVDDEEAISFVEEEIGLEVAS